MMKVHKLFCYCFLLISCIGCGNKDTSLLDHVVVEPMVNPGLAQLLKEAYLVTVQMDSPNRISGLTTNSAFFSDNYFAEFGMSTLGTNSVKNPWDKSIYAYTVNAPLCRLNRNLIVYISSSPSFKINLSRDYGSSWNSFLPQFDNGTMYDFGGNSWIRDILYLNSSNILMLVDKSGFTSSNTYTSTTLLYKIDPSNYRGTLLSSIQGYAPKSMHFINDKVGWLMLNNGSRIAKTTDGGATWSQPIQVGNNESFELAVGSEKNLFLYNSSKKQGHYSHDGGDHWTQTNTEYPSNYVAYGSANVMYALDGARLLKSEDAGVNWKVVQNYTNKFSGVNRLSFFDDKCGIAYGSRDRNLYVTTDGGLNWKLLMASFGYIVN